MPTLTEDGRRLNGKGSKWITLLRRLAIYLRDEFTCAYCGKDLHGAEPWQVTLDHLRPRCKDGPHASANLITACTWCNSSRQDTRLALFVTDPDQRRGIYQQARRKPNTGLARAIISGDVEDPRRETYS